MDVHRAFTARASRSATAITDHAGLGQDPADGLDLARAGRRGATLS
ncbi:hypothetical protein ACIQZO_24990 [Streptomyces sp. NPDC097617]